MKKKVTTFLLTMMLSGLMVPVWGQMGVEDGSKFGHGEDSVRCLENLSLYNGYYRQDDYEHAIMFWRQAFNECPKSSKNMYLHGNKMYLSFFEETQEEAYLDTMLMIWDQRIEMFGSKGTYTGRKGLDLLRYGMENMERTKKAMTFLGESIDMLKTKVGYLNLTLYMVANQALLQAGEIDNETVINNYAKVSDLVDQIIAEKPNNGKYVTAKENIDAAFKSSGAATCDGLIPLFTPRVRNNPEDKELLEKVLSLLAGAGCNDSDLYFETTEAYYEVQPTAKRAYQIANMSMDRNMYEKAYEYFQKAIDLEDSDKKISNYYVKMAGLEFNEFDQMKKAHSHLKQAIQFDPENGAAYLLMGDILGSVKLDGEFENQTIYWLAVDYFVKAKNASAELTDVANNRIQAYAQHFPKKEDCFFRSLTAEGTPYKIGSWINETTTVRFRKE